MDGPGAKTIPILRTKITLPRPHPETTPRRSLEARLVSALGGKLVLVSAPAGYGKTTLLTRVLGDADIPVAWLSLDENDDQPQRFWSNVISALQAVLPGSCGQAQALLGTPQPPPFELVLVELVNDLVYSGQELILVLDDLHEICSAEILGNLAALIEKMPPNLHLILSSRQTPTLQLARLRARRELAEFTAADLRFQPPEIERLFNELFTLDLSAGDLDTLENLTEGWIAGLQLAALILRAPEPDAMPSGTPGGTPVERLVESFQRGHQYVFDYLVQEVLDRQDPELRSFMLATAFLPRLSAPVCDAALIRSDSQSLLERIAAANLFLTPLDSERRWYRYHNLFSSCLQRILTAELPVETVQQLTRRAAAWFDQQDLIQEAVQLATSIEDYPLLAQIVDRSAASQFLHSELVTLTRWLQPLPLAYYEQSPRLGMVYAWALLATAQTDGIEPVLEAVERGLGSAADGSPASFTQPAHVQAGLAEICCVRTSLAFTSFDLPVLLKNSRLVRKYLPDTTGDALFNIPQDILAIANFNEGLVLSFSGQIDPAIAALEESVRMCEQANNFHLLPLAAAQLSNVYLVQGQLRLAESSLLKAVSPGGGDAHLSPMSGVAFARLGLIAYERNQLAKAEELLQQGLELGRRWNSWESALLGHIGLARLYQAQGEPLKAAAELDRLEAEQFPGQAGPGAETAAETVAMHRAALALRQGDVAGAQAWLAGSGLQLDSPIQYFTEEAMLLQARILLASHRDQEALYLAERLLAGLESQARLGRVLEALLFLAVLYERMGDGGSLNRVFERALNFARTEGYQRTLIDLGADFALIARGYSGPHLDYLKQLMDALAASIPAPEVYLGNAENLRNAGVLSQRELEVLRLVADGRTNQEIADQLFISLNTVKTHVRHIFQCLDARNRAEAIARGREHSLI